ncbi:MAG: allantoate amidohydrolase [Bacillus sp. (in: firmicutes)]|nr:allantoate amidohydrolase [Bacillus sp. (in: firmicutes)]
MKEINVQRIISRIEQLAKCSETSLGVTRLSFTEQSEQADQLVTGWMQAAGMVVRKDAMNNLIGRFEGRKKDAPVLLIGSHIDSVLNGGKYDGTLGVITAIEVIGLLNENDEIPEHPIEVISFCDEEGARFHTTFLGSRAMAGTFPREDLEREDDNGISLAEAMRNQYLIPESFPLAKRNEESLLGYLELHIEQGPVLEQVNQPCGVVIGIAGVSRYSFIIKGLAGHAGTVPMQNRCDALSGTAEVLMKIEEMAKLYDPIVATVGKLVVKPGASNVIPETVTGTLDIRGTNQTNKTEFIHGLFEMINEICKRRRLSCQFENIMEVSPVACSDLFINIIEETLLENGVSPKRMISGAGHDAMAIAPITNIGMIFVRCEKGLSHCPEEYVSVDDIRVSTKVLLDTVKQIANIR